MYSKYPTVLLKFLSPVLKKDSYTVTVTVLAKDGGGKKSREDFREVRGALFRLIGL
jgi:hypothetical protein